MYPPIKAAIGGIAPPQVNANFYKIGSNSLTSSGFSKCSNYIGLLILINSSASIISHTLGNLLCFFLYMSSVLKAVCKTLA